MAERKEERVEMSRRLRHSPSLYSSGETGLGKPFLSYKAPTTITRLEDVLQVDLG